MTIVKELANIANTGQALGLVNYNLKASNKSMRIKDVVGLGATNIVGVGLIGATGNMVSLLD